MADHRDRRLNDRCRTTVGTDASVRPEINSVAICHQSHPCHSERSEESASSLSSRGAVLSCHPEAQFLVVILRRGFCAEGPMALPASKLALSFRAQRGICFQPCHPEARFLRRRTYANPASKLALSFRAQRGICFQRAQNGSMSVVRMINSLGRGQFEVIGQLSDSPRDFLRSHVRPRASCRINHRPTAGVFCSFDDQPIRATKRKGQEPKR